MIVVRNCFVAKPGHASKLSAQLKEAAAGMPGHRVVTDLTGDFNGALARARRPPVAALHPSAMSDRV